MKKAMCKKCTLQIQINRYSLDVILAVGYRTNSSKAIAFRIWATKTLKQHLLQGYTINKRRIGNNYQKFMRAVEDVKALLPAGGTVSAKDTLELINIFASTWFSLDAYDAENFPQKGASRKQVFFTSGELIIDLQDLKRALRASLTPEALTALTPLVAESKSKDKEKMIGLILLLLKKDYE